MQRFNTNNHYSSIQYSSNGGCLSYIGIHRNDLAEFLFDWGGTYFPVGSTATDLTAAPWQSILTSGSFTFGDHIETFPETKKFVLIKENI